MPVTAASLPPGRFSHLSVLAVTVAVFGAVVATITLRLRADLHAQIVRREAEFLASIVAMQADDAAEEVPAAMYVAVMKTQKLAGVLGLQIFDMDARSSGTWLLQPSAAPPPELWRRVVRGESIGRLHAELSEEQSAELIGISPNDPAFEAWVPLRRKGSDTLLGVAQCWMRGDVLTGDLAKHDRRIWLQAAVAWLVGSVVIVVALSWAFRRLDVANRQLRARSEDLLRANRELVLAAKTSALGTVIAHLMHELKNPLAGLESIVAGQAENGLRPENGGGELAAASELTRRLRTMVNDVVGVLRDEQTSAEFELTCADIAEVVLAKVQREADERGVKLTVNATPELSVPGRRANLVTLVLRNLLQNALEATPRGRTVALTGRASAGGEVEFLVEDGGSGLPDAVKARLFQPCASSKVGGSGLGLALSHQLAQQAAGRLELVRSDARGTCFRLVLRPEA
ncbi:sensor histidine kinase [Horticoccus sp. 23ND18S-11]|uniref:sensor histidine kinase n=1 Tax=Horticoccus sp. 23ND18S-11 TaxID=3391832 RepID=UPI0039C8C25A